jgi:serine protease Do
LLRLIPDWLLYIIVIAAVVFALFSLDSGQRADAPPAMPDWADSGAHLPPPTIYDPEVLVEVGPASSGLGSAFAISEDGWWVTARHVVDNCETVALIVSRGVATPVRDVKVALFADLALLRTDRAPVSLALDTSERQFQVNQRAYHVGYPQGRAGEVYSRLIGRETLVARGRYDTEEPVLAWAVLGRTGGVRGSLAGISGGPALGANGQVIGVTVAESARRGRIYTASPSSLTRLLRVEQVAAQGAPAPRMTPENYGQQADDLRRSLAVAQVVCVGPDEAR